MKKLCSEEGVVVTTNVYGRDHISKIKKTTQRTLNVVVTTKHYFLPQRTILCNEEVVVVTTSVYGCDQRSKMKKAALRTLNVVATTTSPTTTEKHQVSVWSCHSLISYSIVFTYCRVVMTKKLFRPKLFPFWARFGPVFKVYLRTFFTLF